MAHVLDRDLLELGIDARISVLDEVHQPAGCDTRRHHVRRGGLDGRQALCGKTCARREQNGGKNAYGHAKRHTTPNSATRRKHPTPRLRLPVKLIRRLVLMERYPKGHADHIWKLANVCGASWAARGGN